jgi:hypothetical protein
MLRVKGGVLNGRVKGGRVDACNCVDSFGSMHCYVLCKMVARWVYLYTRMR